MNNAFNAAIKLMTESAPGDCYELKLLYRFYDGAMDINTFYRKSKTDDWASFDVGSFDLMDILDDYRKNVHSDLEKPWSTINLVVDRNNEATLDYGYGDPSILNR